jgi:hypothetical protein
VFICSVRPSSVCTLNCTPHSASASVMRLVITRSSPSRLCARGDE